MLEFYPLFSWIGILICISQSAMFSGLNLALFGVSRLNLDIEVASGNQQAQLVRTLRKDSNFLLATILWGNVAVNCLLTLLSDSVLSGLAGFALSTVLITFGGEIVPQAYFSRNALRMASLLAPVLRIYQWALYPVAKPCALMLDAWLGREGIEYYREEHIREILRRHAAAESTDIEHIEGRGALNFLDLDDLRVSEEGEPIHPDSILELPIKSGHPVFPPFDRTQKDAFLKKVISSGHKWVILTDNEGNPQCMLDADGFFRGALDERIKTFNPTQYCVHPIIVTDHTTRLGSVIVKLTVEPKSFEDDVIDRDIILVWGKFRRIITGADLLGRLFRGIAIRERITENTQGESHAKS